MTKDGIRVNIIIVDKQKNFFSAFGHAWRGIHQFFLHDKNGRIHLGAAIATVMAGTVLEVSITEWLILFGCIGLVIAMEMINAAIEKLCDMVHKEYHPTIKLIKDISAGAVLWTATISALAGAVIFIPKIVQLL